MKSRGLGARRASIAGFAFLVGWMAPQLGVATTEKDGPCLMCHGPDGGAALRADLTRRGVTPDKMEAAAQRLAVDLSGYQKTPHDLRVSCTGCHQPESSQEGAPHDAEVEVTACVDCHDEVEDAHDESVHAKESCAACHTSHAVAGVKSPRDPVFPANQAQTCGGCHKDQAHEIPGSIHDKLTQEKGCGACHGPAHALTAESTARGSCVTCHQSESNGMLESVHVAAGPENAEGVRTTLDCATCHGDRPHAVVSASDARSPVFPDHQLDTCGQCHDGGLKSYRQSVHGHGLLESGLLVTAVCSSCHGAHGIYPADDKRSLLHRTRVAETCGQCHRFLEERLRQSVHGALNGETESATPARGGLTLHKPGCTDCHQGHDLPKPGSGRFRLHLQDRCGNCHIDLSKSYSLSMHGELTELGYGPAAKCSDCHGAHDILPASEAASHLSEANKRETCRACHQHANEGFLSFDPHADHRNLEEQPLLFVAYMGMEMLLFSVFIFFGIHTLLWFIRGLINTIRHGRAPRIAPGQHAIRRFEGIHSAVHATVIISFLGLALTGLPLKYSNQAWAKTLANVMGGFDYTGFWHRACAILTVGYFATHLFWLIKRTLTLRASGQRWLVVLLGPDSPVPNLRDLRDLMGMFRWFFGLGPRPVFERWSYWEKFDYWAVFWGVGIIGMSGFMLWFPNVFSTFLPGKALNIAKIIHSEEALLATGFVFAVHFFNTHFRPDRFPMDMAILTGFVSEEELREERPEWVARMEREGTIDSLRKPVPQRRTLCFIYAGGSLALLAGLSLLAGMLLAGLG